MGLFTVSKCNTLSFTKLAASGNRQLVVEKSEGSNVHMILANQDAPAQVRRYSRQKLVGEELSRGIEEGSGRVE